MVLDKYNGETVSTFAGVVFQKYPHKKSVFCKKFLLKVSNLYFKV